MLRRKSFLISQRYFNKNIYLRTFRKLSVLCKDFVVQSPFKEKKIQDISGGITDYVWLNLHRWADKTAIVCAKTNRFYTYQQLYKHTCIFGTYLRQHCGTKADDVIGVMLPNVPEYAVALLGVLEAGGVVCPFNPNSTYYELQRYITQVNVKSIITTDDKVEILQKTFKTIHKNINIIPVQHLVTDENKSFSFSGCSNVSNNPEDLAILPFSSGTEGLPKCVEISHKNIVANCIFQNEEEIKHHNDTTESHQDTIVVVLPLYHIYGLSVLLLHKLSIGAKLVTLPTFEPMTFVSTIEKHQINLLYTVPSIESHQDTIVVVLPLYHIYGLSVLLLHKLSIGAKLVTLPTFEPMTFVSTIEKHQINLLYTVPSIVQFIGSHSRVSRKQLRSIDRIVCGAAPISSKDVDAVKEKINPNIRFAQLYGSTEALLLTASKLKSESSSSAGRVVPNTRIRIINSDFENQGPNKVGEIVAQGPQVTKGYHKNPECTKSAFTEDGWLRTGDLAKVNENGDITICGRKKELIKVNGYQVSPLELEEIFKCHPLVKDAAVIGVPHPKYGELPKAFIVLNKKAKIEKSDLLQFLNCKVVRYKNVNDLKIVQELPKSPTGKLLRKVLKEEYLLAENFGCK